MAEALVARQTAQRDIFDALSHSLGSATPGQYLQDFWLALPSLRSLLAFDGGWASAQEQTWARSESRHLGHSSEASDG